MLLHSQKKYPNQNLVNVLFDLSKENNKKLVHHILDNQQKIHFPQHNEHVLLDNTEFLRLKLLDHRPNDHLILSILK